MSKHADLANRIFRTVVFSGAMLGTVAPAAADQPAPPQANPAPKEAKPVPPKPDTWDSVNKEIEANDKKLDAAIVKFIAAHKATAKPDPKGGGGTDLALAQGTYDSLRKNKTDLEARLAKTTRTPFVNEKAAPDVEKTEKALAEADTKLFAAIDGINGEKLKETTAAAETARKERVAAAAKVKAARTKAAKRPRAVAEERPTGRGFILS